MSNPARPDLPVTHPQNTPLHQWTDGWLKLSVAMHTDPYFIAMHDHEKRAKDWPVTREEMIAFLVEKDDIPAAGIGAPSSLS